MNYEVKNDQWNIADGTSLVGVLDGVSFHTLVTLFGEPGAGTDKTDAEWIVEFSDGVVATIYNWKNGRAYNGPDAPHHTDITRWNIGGHESETVSERIGSLIGTEVL